MVSPRVFARYLIHTPLHPQWLMPRRAVDERIRGASGYLLDIGAGNHWLKAVVPNCARYISFDYPATAIQLYGVRPDVFGDASQLPFKDESIDVVACYEVLEHVSEPDRAIREIARVLRPGGMAELSMPFLYPVHDAPYDFQRWTKHGWSHSAHRAGLTIDRIEPLNHPVRAAAVLACLALTGPLQVFGRGSWRLPIAAALVPVINIVAWIVASAWPTWDAMSSGHRVVLSKPLG